MATKAKVNTWRLRDTGQLTVNLNDWSIPEALRGLARYLEDHPYANIESIVFHYGEGEQHYMSTFIDCYDND